LFILVKTKQVIDEKRR